ncbi:hypothetical protein C5167_030918 [Papaver somniferum]|nr:hypothetical protein C5167_030918 [Papaver somniferum]
MGSRWSIGFAIWGSGGGTKGTQTQLQRYHISSQNLLSPDLEIESQMTSMVLLFGCYYGFYGCYPGFES